MPNLLENYNFPQDIKNFTSQEKVELAKEVREVIIETVLQNGGHLAPSLGTVELTIALLSVFNPNKDKVIWDVGHQSYAWKILTDRYKNFKTLRTHGGISGFPNPNESPYDHFIAGHAATSISAALGKAYARDLLETDSHVIAVIGDGSLTGGMAFEALNQAGELGKHLIVILNDNNMSISPNVGAVSRFISTNLSNSLALSVKSGIKGVFNDNPTGNRFLKFLKRGERSFKTFTTSGSLFEAFGFNYIGPVDGHDTEQLIVQLKNAMNAKVLTMPVLLHVKTTKGKGYEPAEKNPTKFHGVASIEPDSGLLKPENSKQTFPSATASFSDAICTLAKKDKSIIAITAAMTEGTGLLPFKQEFPERCIDVGICEQHAVTFAAGLATEGFKPVVAIYSTFLQRAYDQIIHDVCLQNLHVIFCIDRAGIVGEDGPTHHGVFDISFLRSIPNMHILVPSSPNDFLDCFATAINMNCPIALRYPRGKSSIPLHEKNKDYTLIPIGIGEFIYPDSDESYSQLREENTQNIPCIITIGEATSFASIATAKILAEENIAVPVFNARWVKPLPKEQLNSIAKNFSKLIIVEENTNAGGFSSAILEYYSDTNQMQNLKIKRLALPDSFVEHGKSSELREKYNISSNAIYSTIKENINN